MSQNDESDKPSSISPSALSRLEDVRDSIVDGGETPQLKPLTEKCSCSDLQAWRDDSGYDLMHYAILVNNHEAVLMLLMKGLFRDGFQPSVPYLHLACELGLRTVTGLLLDYLRPNDYPVVYSHGHFPLSPKNGPSISESDRKLFQFSETGDPCQMEDTKPLDVAAAMGHLSCVRFLLDRYELDRISWKSSRTSSCLNHLAIATTLKSPKALKLLLQAERHLKEDILQAVDVAIRESQPQCLDLLLSQNVDTSSMYSGMNLFHVLSQYQTPLCKANELRLYQMTSVLLKHGYDVKITAPSRTYPLYSLLNCESLYLSVVDIDSHSDCLRALLTAGADPNFDEAAAENPDIGGAYGREAYPSALFCLFHTVYSLGEADPESVPTLSKAALAYLKILLEHGADVRKVAPVYHLFGDGAHSNMTVLHEFIRSSTVVGVDPEVLNLLMNHGVNPMATFKGMLPLTMYCAGRHSRLVKYKTENTRAFTDCSLANTSKLARLCDYLPLECLKRYQMNLVDILPNDEFIREYQTELTSYLTRVRSLKHECLASVWKACSFKSENVERLPLPSGLKIQILPRL